MGQNVSAEPAVQQQPALNHHPRQHLQHQNNTGESAHYGPAYFDRAGGDWRGRAGKTGYYYEPSASHTARIPAVCSRTTRERPVS